MADNNNNNNERTTGNTTPTQPPGGDRRQQTHRNNTYHHEEIFMHYLFLNLSLRYAAYFKSTARRLIEFFSLVNALLMFLVLLYIHLTFVRNSSDCLNHIKEVWPRGGILRVQVTHNDSDPAYKMYFVKEPSSTAISFQSTPFDFVFKYSSPVTHEDVVNFKVWKDLVNQKPPNLPTPANHSDMCPNYMTVNSLQSFHLLDSKCPILKEKYMEEFKRSVSSRLASMVSELTVEQRTSDSVHAITQELSYRNTADSNFDPFEPSAIREHYIIEYSTEFGYLRLSTAARHKLAIPTLVVNLNPNKDECFGGSLKRFMLKTFLGYDDYLMTSIKKLAEMDKSQGYLRNLITGEYFRFVTMWVNHASVIIAFTAMLIFTLIVTMLLRYSYHQIFMFMVEVLRLLDTDIRLVFPAAPMLTIVLALVGMEEIMTEFFHDSTVAFYIILLIWAADQFDVICLHTVVGKRHWVRFFYLYHFAFYVYHYRFNGQYSKLALFTSWLFILHSMLFFLHHFEIPAIQRQMELVSQRNRERRSARNNPGPPRDDPAHHPDGPTPQSEGNDEQADGDVAEQGQNDSPPHDSNPQQPPSDGNDNVPSDVTRQQCYWTSSSFLNIYRMNLVKICMLILVVAGIIALSIHSYLTRSTLEHGMEMVRVIV